MRFLGCVSLAAIAACGGTDRTDGGNAGTRPAQFQVTLDVAGTGTVNGAGKSCTDHCVWQVPAGALHLEALPAASWQFQAWSAECASVSCDLTVNGEVSLTATFTQAQQRPPVPPTPSPPPPPREVPAPPPTQTLSVTIVGGGRVVSTPAGGLMPASVPAPISIPLDGFLLDGTSDATGTDFVFTTSEDFRSPRQQHFVRIENGSASELRSIESDTFATFLEASRRSPTSARELPV
jgi:hypothetical protein